MKITTNEKPRTGLMSGPTRVAAIAAAVVVLLANVAFAFYPRLSCSLVGVSWNDAIPQGEARINQANYPSVLPRFELRARNVDIVCLAGFMRLLGPTFTSAFPHAVLNIHPSLLPSFPGIDAQRQAIAHGVKISGATVHLVTDELDGGPIVLQAAVPRSNRYSIRGRGAERFRLMVEGPGAWSREPGANAPLRAASQSRSRRSRERAR